MITFRRAAVVLLCAASACALVWLTFAWLAHGVIHTPRLP
jgi:hypothetical protein